MQSMSPQEQVLISRSNMQRQASLRTGVIKSGRPGLLRLGQRYLALVWQRQVAHPIQRMRAAASRRRTIR